MKLVVSQKTSQPTLRIYTDDTPNQVGSSSEGKIGMAEELKRVRKELGATKAALKAQVLRCRQLVAAFTRKLQEKEVELRNSRELRDQQLSVVLRSLLVLESRLRKEQKVIRAQLVEKDAVIAKQQCELLKFRGQSDTESPHKFSEERLDSLYRPVEDYTYKDNPVLESVHQILLKDEEDLLNEVNTFDKSEHCGKLEPGVEWYETDSSLIIPEDQQPSGAWCIKVIEEGEEPAPPTCADRLWVKDRTSPPTKAQHLEEKACLQMSKKTLTIALPKELEEVNGDCAVSECSYQELVPVTSKPIYQKLVTPQKPPALPPKPSGLLKPSELLQQRVGNSKSKPDTLPKPRVHLQEIKRKQMNGHVPGNVKPQAHFVVGTRIDPQQPMPAARMKVLPEKKEVAPEVARVVTVHTAVRHDLSDDALRLARHDVGEHSIRMGSSVSSLITGATRESIVTELTAPIEQTVTRQIERKALSPSEDQLQTNFEEFKLDDSYADNLSNGDGRPEADGAEARCGVSHYAVLGPPAVAPDASQLYETFLETTGLSQKSILTPSRLLSNHRSCLKPKDVKLRSRVTKAAAVEKCTAASLGPTVKYWTEPYL